MGRAPMPVRPDAPCRTWGRNLGLAGQSGMTRTVSCLARPGPGMTRHGWYDPFVKPSSAPPPCPSGHLPVGGVERGVSGGGVSGS